MASCVHMQRDPRWPAVAAGLADLRERGRYAVRIDDAECGVGTLLLRAARHARTLGFTAIEAYGSDRSPALIRQARAAAARTSDPATAIVFAVADPAAAGDLDDPADLLLCHAPLPNDLPPPAARVISDAGVAA